MTLQTGTFLLLVEVGVSGSELHFAAPVVVKGQLTFLLMTTAGVSGTSR